MSILNDVNNINVFNFADTIINKTKFQKDLLEDATFGPKFNFFVSNGEHIVVYCSESLVQEEVDAMNSVYNTFVETDVLTETAENIKLAQTEGWDIYKKIIADININGGLGTIDDGIVGYQKLFPIRNMLKDGFSEYSLRYIATVIIPEAMFPTEMTNKYKLWCREHAKKFNGTSDEVLDLIEDASNPI